MCNCAYIASVVFSEYQVTQWELTQLDHLTFLHSHYECLLTEIKQIDANLIESFLIIATLSRIWFGR